MTFDERLRELHQQGNHDQARTLAKAVLRNESITRVEVSPEIVRVETPHFRGTHQVTADSSDGIDVQRHGTYQYKSQEIDLSFTTRTMNQTAFDQATAYLTKQTQTRAVEGETRTDVNTRTSNDTATNENISRDDPVDTRINPVDFLKELF